MAIPGKHFRLLIILLTYAGVILSQNKTDSLLLLVKNSNTGSDFVRHSIHLAAEYDKEGKYDKMYEVAQSIIRVADSLNLIKESADGNLNAGIAMVRMGKYSQAAGFLTRARIKYQALGEKLSEAKALFWISKAEYNFGEYVKALSTLIKANEIIDLLLQKPGEENNRKLKILLIDIKGQIGAVYIAQAEYDKANEYFVECLRDALAVKNGDLISSMYTNIGAVYYYQNNNDSAIANFESAFRVSKEYGLKQGEADALNNIGLIYQEKGDYVKAISYLEQSMTIAQEMGDEKGTAESLLNIGELHLLNNNLEKSEAFYLKSLALSRKIGLRENVRTVYEALAKVYAKKKDFTKAYQYQLLFSSLKDSLVNEDRNKQFAEMQTKYGTEKKQKENVILKQQNDNQKLEAERHWLIIYGMIAFAILLAVLAFFIFRGYQEKKQANLQLKDKNQEIQQKNRIVEEQNKDIKDSIRYAKRLQEAILSPTDKFQEVFSDSFILFKPKDIVSGDFYWFERFGDQVFFAAADCTGHGVPGAFMSILGFNLLNQALNEYALDKPHAILNSVNKGLSKALRQRGEDANIKDGMDIALCAVNTKTRMLSFSGAFNPAWIVRNGSVIDVAGDKFPVGAYLGGYTSQFSLREVPLEKGDCLYIFSDGYADQFGGPKGKKFKYKQLKEVLIAMKDFPMDQQRSRLDKIHDDWKGNLEQVDDILMIGVRI
jgi:serine phosphatase RsbU (regulator of sigma subunit)/tetratricopeptide (TPR) repeat protein